MVDDRIKTLLVHRKGATRAFPPHHPLIPVDYQFTGQPVLIGGTMGTCSYILAGTEKGMQQTFGSTCHGAGRAMSRAKSRRELSCVFFFCRVQFLLSFLCSATLCSTHPRPHFAVYLVFGRSFFGDAPRSLAPLDTSKSSIG